MPSIFVITFFGGAGSTARVLAKQKKSSCRNNRPGHRQCTKSAIYTVISLIEKSQQPASEKSEEPTYKNFTKTSQVVSKNSTASETPFIKRLAASSPPSIPVRS